MGDAGPEGDPPQVGWDPYAHGLDPGREVMAPGQWSAYGPYPAAAWGPPQTNGMAIASLVLGLVGLLCAGLLAAVPAVVLGHLARARIRRTWEGGGGMALAGLILGYVAIGIDVAAFVLWILYVIALVALGSRLGS